MFQLLAVAACVLHLPDAQQDPANATQSRQGVAVKLESLELSRFNGKLESNLGKAGKLVPKLERAIVLTTTVTGANETVAPRIRLANGTLIDAKIHGNTRRRGVQQIKGSEGTAETWFAVDKALRIDAVFPCTVVVAAKTKDGKWLDFTFKKVTP